MGKKLQVQRHNHILNRVLRRAARGAGSASRPSGGRRRRWATLEVLARWSSLTIETRLPRGGPAGWSGTFSSEWPRTLHESGVGLCAAARSEIQEHGGDPKLPVEKWKSDSQSVEDEWTSNVARDAVGSGGEEQEKGLTERRALGEEWRGTAGIAGLGVCYVMFLVFYNT
jgi:hypothetical protein